MQYLHCNSFSIKMCVKSDTNEPSNVQVSKRRYFIRYSPNLFLFQSKELKYFLLENNCRGILLEAESTEKKSAANNDEIGGSVKSAENANRSGNRQIPEESVQFLAEKLMDFIDSKYSMNKWDDVEEVCKAAVVIFPCIELVRKSAAFF